VSPSDTTIDDREFVDRQPATDTSHPRHPLQDRSVLALIADDDRGVVVILETVLRRAGLDVVTTRDGEEAWTRLCTPPHPALAIVDWMMPGIDGLDLCGRIRRNPDLATLYVIVLTARDGRADLVSALRAGADDYVIKPFDLEELQARIQVGLRVATLQQRLAAQVIELQNARDALDRLAGTDVLTDLCTRRRWFEVANSELDRFQRYGHPFSVLVADLDNFKRINDTYGHAAGDDVLRAVARLLRTCGRQSDSVGRLGGEEFAVLMPESDATAASELAARIIDGCRSLTVDTRGGAVRFTCSIGIGEAQPGDTRVEDIVNRADAALYEAKRQGRDRVAAVTTLTSPFSAAD
jgi:diguanylate cyclase (GGDEF)-like protein